LGGNILINNPVFTLKQRHLHASEHHMSADSCIRICSNWHVWQL